MDPAVAFRIASSPEVRKCYDQAKNAGFHISKMKKKSVSENVTIYEVSGVTIIHGDIIISVDSKITIKENVTTNDYEAPKEWSYTCNFVE